MLGLCSVGRPDWVIGQVSGTDELLVESVLALTDVIDFTESGGGRVRELSVCRDESDITVKQCHRLVQHCE